MSKFSAVLFAFSLVFLAVRGVPIRSMLQNAVTSGCPTQDSCASAESFCTSQEGGTMLFTCNANQLGVGVYDCKTQSQVSICPLDGGSVEPDPNSTTTPNPTPNPTTTPNPTPTPTPTPNPTPKPNPCAQRPVDPAAFEDAKNFSILAGSTVTNTGQTTVTGDLGVFSGSAVTGFPPGKMLDGTIHRANKESRDAQSSLTASYNDLKNRDANCAESKIGDIGGTTLTPGLYKSTSGIEVTRGDLTLDGQLNEEAVWIFQMVSTFTIASGKKIILINGAKPRNVFWQVGSSGTIGTSSTFEGTMMADQAISVKTNAEVNGRVLARIAAVTLEGNKITIPSSD